ncbi:dnaB-like helicase C-terminal domain-containing protein [Synechococcus sp. SYN20]|uniref:DnaB-like helicase C-terminal domain-containing protein n=1 Tax=Synechococcus sp. SYN20 TaxID=1050714 RepID=UPI0016476079|nr:DnaB-like helicase C-terminal domain-containing protein [Synechococcus sp. SYN20]QNJ25885.1 dnaB-like helicase C-terminal domain-containing protein [Synechococcus sp. SYN20]
MTDQIQDQVLSAVDELIAEGTFVNGPEGLSLADEQATLDSLDDRREERKASQIDTDDSSDQERLILGFTLNGEKDNGPIWAKFRQALGLRPDQTVPESIWSEGTHHRLAEEIDAIFRGNRDVRTLNGRTLIESYKLRVERDQAHGSVQALSQMVVELREEAGSFVENDMLIAIELLQSSRARSILKLANRNLENALRRDRNVETVVQDMQRTIESAKSLVAGRLGEDIELSSFASIQDELADAMTAVKDLPISTGIVALDMDLQGGVQPSDTGKLNVIGARTGVGKTTLGAAAAMGLTLNGGNTLFLSTELNTREIGARCLSHYAYHRNFMQCRSWVLEGRGKKREIPQGYEEMMQQWTTEKQDGTIGDINFRAMFHASAEDMVDAMYAAKAKNPRLSSVFLDHFHALRPSKGYSNRSQEMEARILFLHQAAKACHVDLFLMAQLNRDACLANKPSIEHINGTDAIGQLATAAWLLEFPKREEGVAFNPGVLDCFHGKFRNGQRIGDDFVNHEQSILQINREYITITSEAHV